MSWSQSPDRFSHCLVGIESPLINLGVSWVHRLQGTAFTNLYRLCINSRFSCRLTAVEGIVYRIVSLCLEHNFQTFLLLIDGRESLCLKNVRTISVTHHIIDGTEIIRAVNESLPALVLRLAPLHLAKCGHARKHHIEQMICGSNILGP